jgi:hypothetical protein
VIPAAASSDETGAANWLADELERVNGVSYSVVSDAEIPADGYLISVGGTTIASDLDTSSLGYWGRSLSRNGRCLRVVSGSRPESIWAAVDLFLERCGICHYGPDPLFVASPSVIGSLPSGNVAQVPDIEGVTIGNIWKPNTLTLDTPGISLLWERDPFEHAVHSFGALLTTQDFIDHPNITPTYDGVDTAPTAEEITSAAGWQPCMHYTDDLADALMPAVLASLANHEAIQISPCDSGGYCECDECAADIVAAGGSVSEDWSTSIPGYSAQYHALLEEILERSRVSYPNCRVVGLAYANVGAIPASPLSDGISLLNTIERPLSARSQDEDYEDRIADWSTAAEWSLYDRMHGSKMSHPGIVTDHLQSCLAANTPRDLMVESSPSWGLMLAQPYILHRLSWDVNVNVAALWRQWAVDLFGAASEHMLAYVDALERLSWLSTTPPPVWRDYRSQLAPRPGQVDVVDEADAALAAAMATSGLNDDTVDRLGIISAAWDVTATLIRWSNSETPPNAEDEAAFWARFEANVVSDNRTLWRTDNDALRSWVRVAVDYAARRLSEFDCNVDYSAASPASGEFIDLPALGSDWRIDWTSTRGSVPGQSRLQIRPAGSDAVIAGRWRSYTDQVLVYLQIESSSYQEIGDGSAVLDFSLIHNADGWRFFVNGRQLMSGSETLFTPTRYFISLTGDESVSDLVVRSNP